MASVSEERTFPLKRPLGHKVPVPRWSLKFPDSVTHVYTLYVGIQSHSEHAIATRTKGEDIIEHALISSNANKPTAVDTFRVTDGFDLEV
jgi:hypothetical protein